MFSRLPADQRGTVAATVLLAAAVAVIAGTLQL
jgi:hypothetical protein